jgi:hypothetical protein
VLKSIVTVKDHLLPLRFSESKQSLAIRFSLYIGFITPLLLTAAKWIVPIQWYSDLTFLILFFWVSAIISYVIRQRESLYEELSLPMRLCRNLWFFIERVVREFGTLIFRVFAWSYIQRIALGLDGYPIKEPNVSMTPVDFAEHGYYVVNLPDDIVSEALERRQMDIDGTVELITEALAQPEFALADLNPILMRIARDTALVHALAYTNDWGVEVIAEWIEKVNNKIDHKIGDIKTRAERMHFANTVFGLPTDPGDGFYGKPLETCAPSARPDEADERVDCFGSAPWPSRGPTPPPAPGAW